MLIFVSPPPLQNGVVFSGFLVSLFFFFFFTVSCKYEDLLLKSCLNILLSVYLYMCVKYISTLSDSSKGFSCPVVRDK